MLSTHHSSGNYLPKSSRFYLEDYLSFKQIDISFEKGLNVFTGPSGAGKSVLMSSIYRNKMRQFV